VLTAMSDLHDDAPDACHGTLAAERVVVTSKAHVVIVERAPDLSCEHQPIIHPPLAHLEPFLQLTPPVAL
jgi:hypothetical protein